MRAFHIPKLGAGLDSSIIGEVAPPQRQDGQVLVNVAAAALNPADVKVIRGEFAGRMLRAKTSPLILGYDFAGTIAETVSGSGFAEGDEVYGFQPYSSKNGGGTLAEQIVTFPTMLAAKPNGVSMIDAARAATVGLTALQGLRDKLKVTKGQRVLVNGASGGVGVFAVQIAKLLGATVVGTCSAAKAAAVEELGADEVVDYRKTSIAQLSGRFDAVFDAAAASSYAECAAIMTDSGRYLTTLPSLGLVTGMMRTAFSSRACGVVIVNPDPSDFEQLGAWLADGSVVVLGEAFPLDDAKQAFERLTSGEVTGKVGVAIV